MSPVVKGLKKLYKDQIERLEKDNQYLISRYGQGVRPAWVSTDLSYNQAVINDYKELLAELEKEHEC